MEEVVANLKGRDPAEIEQEMGDFLNESDSEVTGEEDFLIKVRLKQY